MSVDLDNEDFSEDEYGEILDDYLNVPKGSVSVGIGYDSKRAVRAHIVANVTLNNTMVESTEGAKSLMLDAINSTGSIEYLQSFGGAVVSVYVVADAVVITTSGPVETSTTSTTSISSSNDNISRNIALGVALGVLGLAILCAIGVIAYITYRKNNNTPPRIPSVRMKDVGNNTFI